MNPAPRDYLIGGLRLRLAEPRYAFRGLEPFAVPANGSPDVWIVPDSADPGSAGAPPDGRTVDTFDFAEAGADCRLTRTGAGYRFTLAPRAGRCAVVFRIPDAGPVLSSFAPGDDPALMRFGIWMTFNLRALLLRGVAAVHASVVVHRGSAVLFLGESGTGKSTHTRLWCRHIPGTELLNDDSPLVGLRDDAALACGSPWSGKTPCFRNSCHPVRAFVRLEQAPVNRIERLTTLGAYAALQPSFPPSFAHDERLADAVNALLSGVLRRTAVYRLGCLPDADAVRLVHRTLFEP